MNTPPRLGRRGSRRLRQLGALALCLCSTSCAWASDRARDLSEVFTLEGMVGLGLSADVKATELAHVGAGYAHGRKLSLRGGEARWLWDREVGLPASGLLWAGALRDLQPWRWLHLHTNGAELLHAESAWRLFDLELGAFAGVLGLRVGFSPGELVDLLAGLVGLDPAGDDLGEPLAPAPDEPREPGVWLAGDLHAHCDPPDGDHAPVTVEESWELAADAGLDFIGINPHLWLRGRAPAQREGLLELQRQVGALEGRGGPIVIPGMEVMVGRRRGPPMIAAGHALLLFRDPAEGLAFAGHPAPDERAWVRERLTRVPRERWLWAPTHPWPHPRIQIPFFPDWAAPWKQLAEGAPEPVTLGGQGYLRRATPWSAREERRGGARRWRLVRLALPSAARADRGRELRLLERPSDARGSLPVPAEGLERGARRELPRGSGVAEVHSALAEELADLWADADPPRGHADPRLGRRAGHQLALRALLAQELPGFAGDDPARLELVLPVARNAWLWLLLSRDAAGPLELELLLLATPVDPDGRVHPGLHEVAPRGYETLSGLVHLASRAVGRRGAELDRDAVFALLDRKILAERRRLVPLAGSDNHRDLVFPTIWAFARERSREAIFDALWQGRVCVGGPEARALEARSDQQPGWRAIGANLKAERWVELRWEGSAELFVDGVSRGRRRAPFRHPVEPGALHVYRIVRGPSWSGFVYVNLPE